jgi:hypothetical protein
MGSELNPHIDAENNKTKTGIVVGYLANSRPDGETPKNFLCTVKFAAIHNSV